MSSKDAPRLLQITTTRHTCRCGARLATGWDLATHRRIWCPYGAGSGSDRVERRGSGELDTTGSNVEG